MMMTLLALLFLLLVVVARVSGWSGPLLSSSLDRRQYITSQAIQLFTLMGDDVDDDVSSTSTVPTSSLSSSTLLSAGGEATALPPITDKLYMDIRISRNDGTFYVRDDLPNTFENQVIYARLTIGLFGTVAPATVEKFKQYALPDPSKDNDVNNPLPSYSRSTFTTLDQNTGLLVGGNIPSLRLTEVSGSTAFQYGSRILPAPLWIDSNKASKTTATPTDKPISHTTKGLLTHRVLDVTPTFGITTRSNPTALDGNYVVFGTILFDDETTKLFKMLQDIPTYSEKRPTSYDDPGNVASSVFNAQRDFFRGAAKSFGDTRVSKIYDGKLLRRMEVTKVGLL